MTVIGVDVGGTTIKALPVDVHGGQVDVRGEVARRPTPADPDAVLATIADVVDSLRDEPTPDVEAVGVVVPGIIDEARGVAVFAAHVGWSNVPVVDRLTTATGLPVRLGHDVRAGGLAEWRLGAARNTENALVVMLGTGVGAAAVVDARLFVADGYAGQLGHVVVEPDGTPCGCGQRGCLGTLASASAIVRRYRERADEAAAPAAATGKLGAVDVARRARGGDPIASQVWDEATEALADGLVTAVTLLGSEVVVLGGGLALAGAQLLDPVREKLRARLTFQRTPVLARAQLGDESGILGAALLAADR